jgi:ribosomal protein S18 acetylase RimI-like enzyme
MRPADVGAVTALWEQAGMWPHVGEDQGWLKRAVERNAGCALVWREEGRVVGTVIGAWDGLRGWIYRLVVAEEHQGGGIGTSLLRAAEARLRTMGVKQINLMVYEESPAAEAFYARRGYERSPVKVMRKRSSGHGTEGAVTA